MNAGGLDALLLADVAEHGVPLGWAPVPGQLAVAHPGVTGHGAGAAVASVACARVWGRLTREGRSTLAPDGESRAPQVECTQASGHFKVLGGIPTPPF